MELNATPTKCRVEFHLLNSMLPLSQGKRFVRLYDNIPREEVFIWTSRFSDYDQSCQNSGAESRNQIIAQVEKLVLMSAANGINR